MTKAGDKANVYDNQTSAGASFGEKALSLLNAINTGDEKTVKLLVANNPDLLEVKYGYNPGDVNALRIGHKNCTIFHIESGKCNDVAFSIWDEGNHQETISMGNSYPLPDSFNINIEDRQGTWNTVLHVAILGGRDQIAQYLVEQQYDHQVSLSTGNNNRNTPLHLAASQGNGAVVDALLQKGAEVAKTNNQNKTAFEYAYENFRKEPNSEVRNQKLASLYGLAQATREANLGKASITITAEVVEKAYNTVHGELGVA